MGAIEDQSLTIQEDPSSNEEYEELNSWKTSYPSYHLIRNDDVMNEEDDDVEGSRRSLPTKQTKDKYSIVI